ncbi:MAG: radical SAM protein [Planctomycetes bacterium]|nr:radical SAM protein [Planctomycetota bacterium]
MPEKEFKHVFGPVPSRRLGRSLGIDLVPFKTCTYDCIYCQLGRTTCKTLERKEYVPLGKVLEEIERSLAGGSKPDYLTLSGSGEPTLYSRLGELINGIKNFSQVPVAVLTNGSLLSKPEIREELAGADLVVPSLDAGNEKLFQYANRPHPVLTFKLMLEGLIKFCKEFEKPVWLEVFLLEGVTSIQAEVERIAECVRQIKPDRVQLNTVSRPPAENFAGAVPQEQMLKLAELFTPKAEVVADYSGIYWQGDYQATREEVVNTLSRRPCTVTDIAKGLGIHPNEAIKHLTHLTEAGIITSEEKSGKLYYLVK